MPKLSEIGVGEIKQDVFKKTLRYGQFKDGQDHKDI